MRLLSFVSVVLLLGYGCAPVQIKMSRDDWNYVKAQPEIVAVHYPPSTPFTAATRERSLVGGLLGVALYVAKGNEMVKDHNLEDPILQVKNNFLSAVVQNTGITSSRSIQEPQSEDSLDELQKALGKSLVIDFKTTEWVLSYIRFDWSHYRLRYLAQARLIRLNEPRIIWQGVCKVEEDQLLANPTWDEIIANNASLLKAKMKEAANRCADQLIAQFLGKES